MKRLGLFLSLALVVSPSRGLAAAASDAEERLAAAVRQVEQGDFEAAIPALEAVVGQTSTAASQSKLLARAYLYLAIAYLGLSQEADAKARFLDAVVHDSSLSLSPREFPPKIIHYFEEAKREAEAAPEPQRATTAAPAATPGAQPFLAAVKAGDFPRVRDALDADRSLLQATDATYGATPLHWAALKGHEAIVALLVSAGADLSATNADGETPLQVAARGRDKGIMKLLMPSGATEFFEAVKAGDVNSVRVLLEISPALLTTTDADYRATGLHWAALKGHAALVSFLVAAGADPQARNGDGETPLQVARRANRAEVVQILAR